LHQVAQTYSSRPSAILCLSDSWLAYQVDVAALLLGQRVEALVADGKTSVAEALRKLEQESHVDASRSGVRGQGSGPSASSGHGGQWANQKWKDPRSYVSKVMAVPESGIW
jgi:hypothetical protein